MGQTVASELERVARGARINQLVLLTQNAAEFFARQGYRVIERSAAPHDMQSSEEFRSLCPSSATCMAKCLLASTYNAVWLTAPGGKSLRGDSPRNAPSESVPIQIRDAAPRRFHCQWAGIIAIVASLIFGQQASATESVTIRTQDGANIAAQLYGSGSRGVVLAHGGRFTKEDWAPQADFLAAHGFRVLAFDFRGFGESPVPPSLEHNEDNVRFDVLAAVRYLHEHGAHTVSVIGASFGGIAAADASADSAPGEIGRVVLLAHGSSNHPELMKGRKLFIVSRDDTDGNGTRRLTEMRKDYKKVPPPKRFLVLEGSAHAQFLFKTDQRDRLMKVILQFLSAP